jgi:hypothetical protein
LDTAGSRRADKLAGLHQSMSMLKEAEVNPNHRLYTLLEAYRRTKALAAQAEAAKQRLEAFVAECDRMGTLQARAVAAISGHQLAKWEQETASLLEKSLGRSSNIAKREITNALSIYGNIAEPHYSNLSLYPLSTGYCTGTGTYML